MNYFLLLPTKTKILILSAFVLVIISLSLFIALNTSPAPVPSPEPTKINPIQRGIPNITPTNEIETNLGVQNKIVNGDGTTTYTLKSNNPLRPDEIITNTEGKAVFERIYIPEDPSTPGYMTIDQVQSKYGEPEEVIQGSKFWGGFPNTYIYASRGFAFIANPYTKELFEMHVFTPSTTQEYKLKYGSDITGKGPQPEF